MLNICLYGYIVIPSLTHTHITYIFQLNLEVRVLPFSLRDLKFGWFES